MNNNKIDSRKNLGIFAVIMINVIAVDSLRTLPFSAAFGSSIIFYYLLAGLCFFLPIAYVTTTLTIAWPNKGGIYVWVREAFGERLGFATIWLQWIYNIIWYPTILTFIASSIAYLINPSLADNKLFILSMIISIFWGATFANFFSIRILGLLSSLGAVFGTIIPMIVIIFLGMIWIIQGHNLQISFSEKELLPNLLDLNNQSFLLAILFGLIGIEVASTHADEVNNPHKVFPRAILCSALIIFFSLLLSSLAIAIVVPKHDLNVITGLTQAFELFFKSYGLQWLTPVFITLIVVSGISSVATWIISPTKGLFVAARDINAPAFFAKTNRYGSPTNLLFIQAIICSLISCLFLFMPTVSSSYWVLTAITAQLAMLVYIALFAAAIKLKCNNFENNRAVKIPGKKIGIWLIGILGIATSVIAICLGFVPPNQIQTGQNIVYESILVGGILIFCLPPFLIYRFKKVK